jgi:hypothetical protein
MKIRMTPKYGIKEPDKHKAKLQTFIIPTLVVGILNFKNFGFVFLSIFFLNYYVSLNLQWDI